MIQTDIKCIKHIMTLSPLGILRTGIALVIISAADSGRAKQLAKSRLVKAEPLPISKIKKKRLHE